MKYIHKYLEGKEDAKILDVGNVECPENERTQRIGGLFFSACTDVFGLAVKIDIGFTAHPVPHPILCEFACVSQQLTKRVLLSYTKSW